MLISKNKRKVKEIVSDSIEQWQLQRIEVIYISCVQMQAHVECQVGRVYLIGTRFYEFRSLIETKLC